jgi:hypothetical protein
LEQKGNSIYFIGQDISNDLEKLVLLFKKEGLFPMLKKWRNEKYAITAQHGNFFYSLVM